MPKRLKNQTDDTITPPQGDPFKAQLSAYMARIGKKGGRIGGKRRLQTLSDERREQIAREAAKKRWAKKRP